MIGTNIQVQNKLQEKIGMWQLQINSTNKFNTIFVVSKIKV